MKTRIFSILALFLAMAGNSVAQNDTCGAITRLHIETATPSGAIVKWNRPTVGIYESASVEWCPVGSSAWLWGTTTDTMFAISGLNPATAYQVRVAAMCQGNQMSDYDTARFHTHHIGCAVYDTLQSASPTVCTTGYVNGTGSLPLMTNRRFSFSEQLVLSSELQDTGNLHAISFMLTSSVNRPIRRRCAVYVANTVLDSLSDSTYIHPSQMTMVYEGLQEFTSGWNTIEFNLANFHYSGDSNLLIAVADNSDSAYLASYTFRVRQSPRMSVSFWSMTGGCEDMTNMHSNGTGYYRNEMQLHFAPCQMPSSCHAPAAYIGRVSGDSVTVHWASGSGETQWHLYSQTDSSGFIYEGTVYENHYSFSGLDRGVRYTFRIMADCADSLFCDISIVTTCLPVELPVADDFELWATGTGSPTPPCWLLAGTYTTNSTPGIVTFTSHSGSQCLLIPSTTVTNTIVVFPQVEPTFDLVQLNCWVRKRQTAYDGDYTLLVGAVPDSVFLGGRPSLDTLVATFAVIDSITVGSTEWQFIELPLYETTVYEGHLALLSPTGRPCNVLIDDLNIDYMPSCPHPTGLTLDRSTGDSLFLHWDGSSWPQGWVVECGPQHFFTTDTSIAIGGLDIQTSYPVALRAWCNDGDTSQAITDTFSTTCGKIATLPYSYNFDQVTNGGYNGDGFAECWTRHINYTQSYYTTPYIGNQQNDNIGNQTPTAHSGNQYLRFYVTSNINGPQGQYQWVTLPEIDTTALPIGSLKLSFWARGIQNGTVHLQVGVMSNPDSIETFVGVDTVTITHTNGNNSYSLYEVLLNSYTGYGNHLALKADRSMWTYNILVDDVTLEAIPSCPHVTGLSNPFADHNQLQLSWTEMGSATSWRVEHGPVGFTEGTGTTDTAYAIPFIVGGLLAETNYDFIVHPICPEASEGVRATFTTTAFYHSLPFHDDFSSGAAAGGWNFHQRRTGSGIGYTDPVINSWAIGSATGMGDSAALYVTPDNGTTYDYYPDRDAICLAWTDIMLPDSGTYDYSFDYRCTGGDASDVFNAVLIPATVDMSTVTSANSYLHIDGVTYGSLVSNNWSNRSGSILITPTINGRHPGVYHLAFYWRNDGPKYDGSSSYGGLPAAVDNIHFNHQSCTGASAVNMYYVGSDSLRFGWSLSGGISGSAWIVECGDTSVVITGAPYIFAVGGLSPSTTYAIRVTRLCPNGDTAMTFTTFQTTLCSPIQVPYYEDFDNVTTVANDAEGLMPQCWHYQMTTTGNNSHLPGICYGTSYSHSGNYSLKMRSNGQVILPDIAPTLDSVRISFWHYGTNVTVGVLEGSTFVPVQTCYCQNYAYTQHTVTFENYSGSSHTIAIQNQQSNYGAQNWIDDIAVEYVSFCHPATNIHATAEHDGNLTVDWESYANGFWQVEYGPVGFTPGTGTSFTTIGHPTSITLPDSLNTVDLYVRPICGIGDTGEWAGPAPVSAPLCENPSEVSTGFSSATSTKHPLSLNHNYSFVETIITADELQSSLGDVTDDTVGITAIAFYYRGTTPMTSKDSVDIWLQPTTLGSFSWSQWPIYANQGLLVYSGSLNCQPGWNYFSLSQPFFWNGTSNLMVAIDDRSGQSDNCGGSFGTVSTANQMTVGAYANNTAFDPYNPPRSDVMPEPTSLRPMMKLVSCAPHCPTPYNLTVTATTPTSGTLTWNGNAGNYQIQVASPADSLLWDFADTTISVPTNMASFVMDGLVPESEYFFRLRLLCDTDFVSDWIYGSLTTPPTPCEAPTDLSVTDQQWDGATLQWTSGTGGQQWQLHVWNTAYDTLLTTTQTTLTVSGLNHSITYYAAVRGICDQWGTTSPWSDTVMLTTAECPVPEGLEAETYYHNAYVSWQPTTGLYDIEYGSPNFAQGTGTSIYGHEGESIDIDGLESNSTYDFFVRSRCADGYSPWSERLRFTTDMYIGTSSPDNKHHITLSPNPAKGSTTVSVSGISGAVTIKVTDICGRQLQEQTVDSDGNSQHIIPINHLPSGAYFVVIKSDDFKVVKKLIVQ